MGEYDVGREIDDLKARIEKLELPKSSCSPQICGPATPRNQLVWEDDALPIPVGYVGEVPETVEETYQVLPLMEFTDGGRSATVTVWLHTSCRRKYNTFAQKNWSKAWTTDAKDGGNYVNVGELTTWLYSYFDDGNRTAQRTVTNDHIVEQGPKTQDNTPWPGFTPYQLSARSWSRRPTIEGREISVG